MTRFCIHLPPHQLPDAHKRTGGFYGALATGLAKSGGEVVFRERAYLKAHSAYEPDAFHFVHQGLVVLPNALNTGPSYLRDFWYADPKGVFGLSSLHDLAFDEGTISPERAAKFSGWLRKRIVDKRVSKHGQPDAVTDYADGAIAVFLPGESLPVQRAAYTDEISMVSALIAARDGRPVLIKRHPRNESELSWPQIVEMVQQHSDVHIVDGNIHDVLRGAAVCASISSSVAVEAMLHRVPSLTFGRTDFHHCTQTVRNPDNVPEAMRRALATEWPFDAFLFWFFRQNCLDLRSKNWLAQLNRRMGAFSLKGLGRA